MAKGMSKAERNRRMAAEIAEKIKQAKDQNARVSFAGRLEVLRKGSELYGQKNAAKAAEEFRRYLAGLEMWKKVPDGKLTPKLFNPIDERSELLLVCGIYWDLAKLFDQLKSEKRRFEFLHYMQKYIEFSKGMPYEAVAAENVRKYLRSNDVNNPAEFKNAYKQLGGGSCVVATSLSDQVAAGTTRELRFFRENTLIHSRPGRWFIQWYSENGLGIALWMDRRSRFFRKISARFLDAIALSLRRFQSSRDGSSSD